jgi:cysteinyl-tRNA synthetase
MIARVNGALDTHRTVRAADRDAVTTALDRIDQVLALLEVARTSRSVDDDVSEWVERMITEREAARAARDWSRADAIRDELAAKGIVLEDGPSGTRWKVGG